jgi:hypothetical protein
MIHPNQLHPGDRVKIVDGTFVGREGRVGKYAIVFVITLFWSKIPENN